MYRQLDDIRMRELAAGTGGRALFLHEMKKRSADLDDVLGQAFEQVARELRGLYLLSYQPKRKELDGRWHQIQVEATRPGLWTRFRPAYLAAELD